MKKTVSETIRVKWDIPEYYAKNVIFSIIMQWLTESAANVQVKQ